MRDNINFISEEEAKKRGIEKLPTDLLQACDTLNPFFTKIFLTLFASSILAKATMIFVNGTPPIHTLP